MVICIVALSLYEFVMLSGRELKRIVTGIKKEDHLVFSLVPGTGLEPALLSEHAPETCASTNSATRASGRVPTHGTFVVKKNNAEVVFLCPGQDLNLHRPTATTPSK